MYTFSTKLIFITLVYQTNVFLIISINSLSAGRYILITENIHIWLINSSFLCLNRLPEEKYCPEQEETTKTKDKDKVKLSPFYSPPLCVAWVIYIWVSNKSDKF